MKLRYFVNRTGAISPETLALTSLEVQGAAQAFHSTIPGYEATPLTPLDHLAQRLGVAQVLVKDESKRFGLNAFKALGGSYAMARHLGEQLGLSQEQITFEALRTPAAREKLGVGERICIVSFGGSLGARRINEAVAQLMAWEQQAGGFYHIHATGRYEKPRFPGLLAEAGVDPAAPGLDVREYINDMADCLAAADLVISRSGAMTLSELEASGTASILIPSPNVAENHQYHNAMVLQNHDAAVVVQEKELTPQLLRETVQRLTDDPAVLRRLGKNAQAMAILDANERIYQEILALLPSGG